MDEPTEGKLCPQCGEQRQLTDFHNNRTAKDGKQTYCKICAYGHTKRYRERKAGRRIAERNSPKDGHKICLRCGERKVLEEFRPSFGNASHVAYCNTCRPLLEQEYRDKHRPQMNRYLRGWRDAVRERVIAKYGGKCECCGEANPRFLSLDHINNDGREHRKGKGTVVIYLEAEALPYPNDRLRLLCYNCNIGRAHNKACKGVCPHHPCPTKEE